MRNIVSFDISKRYCLAKTNNFDEKWLFLSVAVEIPLGSESLKKSIFEEVRQCNTKITPLVEEVYS